MIIQIRKYLYTEAWGRRWRELLKKAKEIRERFIKDLGWANGWKSCPKQYIKCCVKKHRLIHRKIGHCVTESVCYKCNIKFTTDSSD